MNFKPHTFLLSLFALLLGFGFTSFFVADVEAEDDPTFSVQTCPNLYYNFIATVRSENTRSETVQDFFSMGYCQLSDIMALNDELDALQDQFRTAAFNCEDVSSYKEEYERILMEQYFVRHVQDTRSDVLNAVDVEQLEAQIDEKLEILKTEMIEVFVNQEKRVSENTLETYFENWTNKYEDSLAKYRECDEGAWAELGETWQDFVETIQDLSVTVEVDKGKSFKDIVTPSVEVDADRDMTAFGSALKNAWEYVKSESEKRKNEIETPLQASDIKDSDIVTFEQAFQALNEGASTYDLDTQSADRMGRYKVLYGMGGSVAATNMQSVLVQLNLILAEMNTKDLPSIATGASKVYDKQCN